MTYCLKCKNDTDNVNSKVIKTKSYKTMLLSKCAVCGSEKSKFIKDQEAKGLLSSLGFTKLLNKIPLLGDILF